MKRILLFLTVAFLIVTQSSKAQCPIPQNNNWKAEQMGSGFDSDCYSLHINSQGDLFAGGDFTEKVVQWNGNSWAQLGVPFGSGGLAGRVFELNSSGSLFAVGNNGGSSTGDILQEWNGNSWVQVTGYYSSNTSQSVAVYNSSIYVGHDTRDFSYNGTFSYAGVFEWNTNTQSMSALGDGLTNSTIPGTGITPTGIISALATTSNGFLYASGSFNEADGLPVNNFALWNGSFWESVGGGLSDAAEVLVISSNGDLYAGGYFTTAGNASANHVAVWNGTTWSALGSGLNGNCYALAFDSQGNLYAGGNFNSAGGISVNNLAKWDGSSWSAIGTGTNAPVRALAVDDCDRLIVGGEFTQANGVSANRIALFYTECNLDTSVAVSGSTLSSNASNVSYQWVDCNNGYTVIPGANSASFTPTISGTFAVIVSDQCADTSGCRRVCVGPNVNVTVSNQTLTATPAGLSYQWIDCNNGNASIPGANGQFYTATESGTYAVEVEENGCANTSNCQSVSVDIINSIGINNAKADVQVFPNPVQDVLQVEVSSPQEVLILNVKGQLIDQSSVDVATNLDLSNYAEGIYFIRLLDTQQQKERTIKILKTN